MNLLEHHIKEIHHAELKQVKGWDLVEVDLTYSCYGITERKTKLFWPKEWEDAKTNGYFMG